MAARAAHAVSTWRWQRAVGLDLALAPVADGARLKPIKRLIQSGSLQPHEVEALKEVVAEQTLELRLLKKT